MNPKILIGIGAAIIGATWLFTSDKKKDGKMLTNQPNDDNNASTVPSGDKPPDQNEGENSD